MQVPTKEIELFVILITLAFLLAPLTLILVVNRYNLRKKRYMEEKIVMQKNYESEIATAKVEVHEQTLQTLGADLHDYIGQLLSLTNLTLKSIDQKNEIKTKEKLDAVIGLTSKSIQELRQLGKLLQGEQLVKEGLINSIGYELDWIKRMGIFSTHLQVNTSDNHKIINANSELMIFRIFQETINNVLRHSDASEISVDITYTIEGVELKVADNGKGFDSKEIEASKSNHMGLFNIQHRANIIHGSALIESWPGLGTTVTVKAPYESGT